MVDPDHVRPPGRPDAASQDATLKLTAVVVTHDLDLMRRVADKVVVLYEGRAIYFGPVDDLENRTTRTSRSSSRWTGWKSADSTSICGRTSASIAPTCR